MTTPDRPDPVDRLDRPEHRMERSYEVAATPEQVWDAIATADGISAWMLPTRLDPRIGGEVTFDLGELQLSGVVTDYAPNRRFAYEEPWPIADQAEDIPAEMVAWFASIGVPISQVLHDRPSLGPIATEFLVESASGGSCVIRVVTSAYGTGSDWENEFFTQMIADVIPMWDNLATYLERGEVVLEPGRPR